MSRILPSPGACAALCALAAFSCNDLVENVPDDVCASGKRWVGEKTGHEEMYPGADCVGCHKDNDGPQFMAGGTVYGVYDESGDLTSNDYCFGLEGAKVTITGGDGQVFSTTTNRAGNFFFEGRESSLVKPFNAIIEYDMPDGSLSRQRMDSSPSYGGCAHCHNPTYTTTTDKCPGGVFEADEFIQVTPLYTGLSEGGPPVEPPPVPECVP